MDLIKKLTGKNPAEYELVAKHLVDNADTELFAKLVKQDDFLFEYIKNNVSKRIQAACNQDNYLNLLKFLEYYSPSYDTMIARVLYSFSGNGLLDDMKKVFTEENLSKRTYAAKYFSFVENAQIVDMLPWLRENAYSEFEPLSVNSIEILAKISDNVSLEEALNKLSSEDEFVQFDGVKFLTVYQAKNSIEKIVEVMKKSSLSENIAEQIPYLMPLEELFEYNEEMCLLVACYIISAIPEIISLDEICNYDLYNLFEKILSKPLDSTKAVLLRLAKDKFEEIVSNDEYLFDLDKNSKDLLYELNDLLSALNSKKLESLLYDELFDGSDFVFFAIDYVDEVDELIALLDSENETLLLKTLSLLKEKGALTQQHKDAVLNKATSPDIKMVVEAI